MIPEIEALKWAASPAVAPPDVDRLDEEALKYLLLRHGLVQRFVERALRERPRWCRGVFLAVLRLAGRDVKQHVHRQIAVASRLTQKFGTPDAPPIVFKGQAVYALTADPRTLRMSGDVDFLPEDPAAFAQCLLQEGYTGEYSRSDWNHEEATLSGEGVTVEVHRGFPLPRTRSAPVGTPAGTPQEDTGDVLLTGFEGPDPLVWLRYADVREGAIHGLAAGTEGIMIPDPAMLALLLCCHLRHHLVNSLMWMTNLGHDSLMLRLAEIADIEAVTQHPRFNPSHFAVLTERYAAQAAVGLAAQLAWELLGLEMLPAWRPSPGRPIRLALHLGAAEGKALIPTTADALLVDRTSADFLRRHGAAAASVYDREMGAVLGRMGAQQISPDADPMTPERFLVPPHGGAYTCQVSAAWQADTLTLNLRMPRVQANGRGDYKVMTVYGRFGQWHAAHFGENGLALEECGEGHARLEMADGDYVLILPLVSKDTPGRQEVVPVLLHLMFQHMAEEGEPSLEPITLIPLLVLDT